MTIKYVCDKELLITDNALEELRIKWDKERFAVIHQFKRDDSGKIIILNPKEAKDLTSFIAEALGETKKEN